MIKTIDNLIDSLGRLSALAAIRDDFVREKYAARPCCGNCRHWMCSRSCPRERNVNGRHNGPSCNATPCLLFEMTPGDLKRHTERMADLRGRLDRLRTPPAGREGETT